MSRLKFLERFESKSTIDNYNKSFKKLDKFLETQSLTEANFMKQLNDFELHEKYKLLQELVDSIKVTVSPRVTRNYFDNLFMYLLIEGVNLDYTQKKLRLKFPRISDPIFEGLDEDNIKTLLGLASKNFSAYMRILAGGGLRETEGLKLEPGMIMFDEFPVRLKLPGTITKYKIPRETFIPSNASKIVIELIEENKLKDNQTIFTKNFNDKTLEDFEKYFAKIRTKADLDTENRVKYQQNDITLHSLRAFFITTFTDHGLETSGRAMAGHSKFKNVYYRKSLKKRQEGYADIMNSLDFGI